MCADDLVIPYLQVFPQCGFTRRKGTICGYFQTAYLSLHRMRCGICAKLQPAKVLPIVQQKGAPQAEKRERKKAQSGQLGTPKCPVYKGFHKLKQGKKG